MPIPKVQHLKSVTDSLTTKTEEIYYAKKAAIESGDKELLHSMGEGKDVMSVLREFAFIYAISRLLYVNDDLDSECEHEGS